MTNKRAVFVEPYCGSARFNATEAARKAGYSVPRQEGSRLLSNADIRAAVEERLKAEAMTAAEVLARLAAVDRMDYSDLAGCYVADAEGRRVLDWGKVREAGMGCLIRKVTPTKYGDSVEMDDRMRALELLGKHLALLVERMRLDAVDFDKLSDDELKAIAAGKAGA